MNYKLKKLIKIMLTLIILFFTNITPVFFAQMGTPSLYQKTDDVVVTLPAKPKTTQDFLDEQLYDAVAKNNINEVNFWLKESANPNSKPGPHETSPLHCAAQNNNLDIVKILVGKGANVRIKNRSGLTPLHYAWFYKSGEVLCFLNHVLRTTQTDSSKSG